MIESPSPLPAHSGAGLAAVLALHAGALGLLARPGEMPRVEPPAVLSVSLLPQSMAARTEPEKAPPVRPAAKRPLAEPLAIPPVSDAAAPAEAVPEPAPAIPASAPIALAAPDLAPAAVVVAPRFDAAYLRNPAPAYPALSRRIGEEGKVVLRVFVEADGRPSQVEVKHGSNWPRLDRAAQEAVRRWQFVPARRGDEAVAAWVLVPIVFNLKG